MDESNRSAARAIAVDIVNAFSRVAKPPSVQISTISNEDADDIIKHLFRYADEVKNFYIPKLLVLAISADIVTSRRSEWIERLVDVLDVDLEEFTPGVDALLKDVRRSIFSSYTNNQSQAVYEWLEFVKATYTCSFFTKEIDSAIAYWRKRANSTVQDA